MTLKFFDFHFIVETHLIFPFFGSQDFSEKFIIKLNSNNQHLEFVILFSYKL